MDYFNSAFFLLLYCLYVAEINLLNINKYTFNSLDICHAKKKSCKLNEMCIWQNFKRFLEEYLFMLK